MYNNFAREAVDAVEAGDICALTGIANVSIGDTICSREFVNPLPTIEVRGLCHVMLALLSQMWFMRAFSASHSLQIHLWRVTLQNQLS